MILAAGAGRRAGGPKADYRIGGQRLVDRAVATARGGGCREVIAVVRAGVAVDDARTVVNASPDRGLASSLALGLTAAAETRASCALVLLVDEPGVTAAAVARLIAARDPSNAPKLWFATYDGVRAHPVRIDRALWTLVADAAVEDTGAKAYARAHPLRVIEIACDELAEPGDLDTAAELATWSDEPRRPRP